MPVNFEAIVRRVEEMIEYKKQRERELIPIIEAEQRRRAREFARQRELVWICGGCGRMAEKPSFCKACNRKFAKKWVKI